MPKRAAEDSINNKQCRSTIVDLHCLLQRKFDIT